MRSIPRSSSSHWWHSMPPHRASVPASQLSPIQRHRRIPLTPRLCGSSAQPILPASVQSGVQGIRIEEVMEGERRPPAAGRLMSCLAGALPSYQSWHPSPTFRRTAWLASAAPPGRSTAFRAPRLRSTQACFESRSVFHFTDGHQFAIPLEDRTPGAPIIRPLRDILPYHDRRWAGSRGRLGSEFPALVLLVDEPLRPRSAPTLSLRQFGARTPDSIQPD